MKKSLQDEKFCSAFRSPEFQVKNASIQEEIRTDIFSSLLSASAKLDELGLSKTAQQTLELISFVQKEAKNKKNLSSSELFFTISKDDK